MTPKSNSPELFYAMANPVNYTYFPFASASSGYPLPMGGKWEDVVEEDDDMVTCSHASCHFIPPKDSKGTPDDIMQHASMLYVSLTSEHT